MTETEQKSETQPAIVIPAYNRPAALKRLLRSVSEAHFPNQKVNVLISLDAGYSGDVKQMALDFAGIFHFGEVRIIEQDQKLGLRKHIRWCGDQTEFFDSVIVLEDDLYVDPWFYQFACKALAEYRDQPFFGGISLFSTRFNEFADLPFEPLRSEYDTFFIQSGSSSGQCWTRKSWESFRAYMDQTDESQIRNNDRLPDWVRFIWPKSSWKKYYNAWLADQNLYMIYPYRTYSTNCSDPSGAHLQNRTSLHQSPLSNPNRKEDLFHFAPMNGEAICYDTFMEITGPMIQHLLGLDPAETEIDLHGIKSESLIKRKKRVITSKTVSQPEVGYPLMFRPIEQNLLHPAEDESEAYFHLAATEDVIYRSRLSGKTYFRLAEFYIRFSPFKSRFFRRYTMKYFQKVFSFITRRR